MYFTRITDVFGIAFVKHRALGCLGVRKPAKVDHFSIAEWLLQLSMALCHLTALDRNLFSFEWLTVDFISYFECLASTFESGVGCEYCQSRTFCCPGCALPQCRDGRGREARIVKFGSTDSICSWQASKLRNSRSSRISWRNLSHQSITKKMSFELLPWKHRNCRSCCEAPNSPLREELLVIVSPQLVKFCGAFHFGSESSMPFACGLFNKRNPFNRSVSAEVWYRIHVGHTCA